MLAQEIRVAGEVLRLADDDARDTELQDGAGAHHAGRQRGVERHPAVALLPAGAAQAVHLAVGDRIALLDASSSACAAPTSPSARSASPLRRASWPAPGCGSAAAAASPCQTGRASGGEKVGQDG